MSRLPSILPKGAHILDLRENPNLGGINSAMLSIAPAFHQVSATSGFAYTNAVLAAHPTGWLFERAHIIDIPLHMVSCKGPLDFAAPFRLAGLIREHAVNIVHTHGYRGNIMMGLLRLFRLSPAAHVITRHGLPVPKSPRLRFYAWLEKPFFHRAQRVVAVDPATEAVLRDHWQIPASRLRCIPNAVQPYTEPSQPELERLRRDLQLQPSDFVVLFLGRLDPEKDPLILLEAGRLLYARSLPISLLFVGSGVLQAELDARAMEIQNEFPIARGRILLAGQCLQSAPFLAISSCLALPSHSEGLSMSLLEAMAAGKPVIASRAGGTSHLLSHKGTGLIVSPANAEELAAAVETLYQDAALAQRLAASAKLVIATTFSPEAHIRAMVSLYAEALESIS